MNESYLHSVIRMNLKNIMLGNRVHIVSFHTYNVQKQAKLAYGIRSQYSITLVRRLVTGRHNGRYLDSVDALFLDLSVGYPAVHL